MNQYGSLPLPAPNNFVGVVPDLNDGLGSKRPHIVESSFKTSFPSDLEIGADELLCKLWAQ